MNNTISVIIPTYRRPDLLAHCLQALKLQSIGHDDFEVIVVSDGPDPLTARRVQEAGCSGELNLRYYSLPSRQGPAAARNAGWKQASGDLIAFTDDDCLPDRYWLQSIIEGFRLLPGASFYGKIIVPVPSRPTDYERNVAQMEKPQFVTANAACTKNDLWQTGGFDERFKTAWREDSDLEAMLMKIRKPPCFLPAAVVIHPVRQAPWGVSIKEQKKTAYNALLYKKHPEYYRRYIRQYPPALYYCMAATFIAGIIFLFTRQPVAAALSFGAWGLLLLLFTIKRLHATRHTADHVTEMLITSACIPFLSLGWAWYGAWKFKNIPAV